MRVLRVYRQQVIYTEGEKATAFFIVVRGDVQLKSSKADSERRIQGFLTDEKNGLIDASSKEDIERHKDGLIDASFGAGALQPLKQGCKEDSLGRSIMLAS